MQKPKGVIQILSKLVSIDSQSYKGNQEIISLVKEWFGDYACQVQDWVCNEDDAKGQNLIVKIAGLSSEKSFVFVCHLDTVPVGNLWETDPFILEEQEGKLYGRGTADTKGGIASLIEAVFTLGSQPTYDTYLVFDGDEERTWTGLKKYLKSLKIQNPQFICIEPTDKNVCIAARSILEFDITTSGKAEHASFATPEISKATNAIYKMQEVMEVLTQDAIRLGEEKDLIMGSNTQNFGLITGGTARNVIAQSCSLWVDRRLLPQKDLQQEIKRLTSLAQAIDKKAVLRITFAQKGFATDPTSDLVERILSCVSKKYPKAQTTCFQAMSEGALLQDVGDVVVLGPGSIAQAHVANEFVETQDIFNFSQIFKDIMLAA